MRKTTMTRQKRQDRKEKNYDDKAKKDKTEKRKTTMTRQKRQDRK